MEQVDGEPHDLVMNCLFDNSSLTISFRHLVQYAQYGFAHSVLTLAHKICVDTGLSSTSIFADILYCLATLGAETNQKSSTILGFALEHFDLRASLNDETEQCYENLSMAHCRLAQAYLINGDYQNSVTHCQSARELLGSRLVFGFSGPRYTKLGATLRLQTTKQLRLSFSASINTN